VDEVVAADPIAVAVTARRDDLEVGVRQLRGASHHGSERPWIVWKP